jgi:hypothetical protein
MMSARPAAGCRPRPLRRWHADAGAAIPRRRQVLARVVNYTDTLVRVEHQSYIPTPRDAVWAALKSHIPQAAWPEASVALACLESIYRCAPRLAAPIRSVPARTGAG